MKKFFALFLALMLLVGCAPQSTDETTETTQMQTAAPTIDPGCYIPGHSIEEETSGAVQAFETTNNGVSMICAMGNNLLLLSGEENVSLTLLTGKKGTVYASAETTLDLNSPHCSYVATADGFAYYDDIENTVIYLNLKLRENNRLVLPDGICGKPFINTSGNVFFAIDNQIRELSPDTQIPRMIKQIAGKDLKLEQFAFDGNVLGCTYTDDHGFARSLYISGETGETLRQGELLLTLDTWQDSYFATRFDGVIKQQIFGTLDSAPMSMNQDVFANLLPLNSVLLKEEKDDSRVLTICDLASGKVKSSPLTLNDERVLCAVAVGNYVWLLVENSQKDNTLYRWDSEKALIETETVYTGKLYTAQDPDSAALTECQNRVDELNRKYEVKIRIWQEAVKVTEGHKLLPEYQPKAIQTMLDRIETALQQLPDGFMRKTGDRNTVRICVVRQIDDGEAAINFWDKDGDIFLVFAIDADFEKEFPLMLGYPVVSHILGNSVEMDYWTGFNPSGFNYGSQTDPSYADGEKRCFADSQAMNSVTDDRSRLFGYALMSGNQEIFQSEAMQGKLDLLCKAIRDSYRLTRYKEPLPWEQYLRTPITPQ